MIFYIVYRGIVQVRETMQKQKKKKKWHLYSINFTRHYVIPNLYEFYIENRQNSRLNEKDRNRDLFLIILSLLGFIFATIVKNENVSFEILMNICKSVIAICKFQVIVLNFFSLYNKKRWAQLYYTRQLNFLS